MEKFSNLPYSHSNIIGREEDIKFLQQLFAKDILRLLTLTGLGGIGKTTLAIHFASSRLEKYPDGVFFVNLAPLTQSERILLEIAHTLKIKQDAQKSTLENIKESLSAKKLLLILDNFEHIMDGASQVNELLQTLPDLQIIVTSREPLQLRIEQLYPVKSLSSSAAVELFMQRALAVKPDLNTSEKENKAIKKLCHRLDGLPLAVELAALRTKLFTPQRLLDRLKPDIEPATRMLDLFSAGTKDLPERQQSLRKMIAWSYSLLDSSEQRALRYASVFPSTFSIETLSTLMNIDEIQAIDLISSLVDKSLVKPSFEEADSTRFFMLESIREFCWNELRNAKELSIIKEAYVELYLELSKNAAMGLEGREQISWLKTIDLEYANIVLAMEISLIAAPISTLWLNGFWILSYLEQYWMIRAYFNELITFSERALLDIEKIDSEKKDFLTVKANVYSIVGTHSWLRADLERARKFHQKSLELYQHLGDESKIAFTLNNIGVCLGLSGNSQKARDLCEQSLALYQKLKDDWGQARSHYNLSDQYQLLSNSAFNLYHAEHALKFAKKNNNPYLIAASSSRLAEELFEKGEIEEAFELNEQAIHLAQEFQFSQILTWALISQAHIMLEQKNLKHASTSLQKALSLNIEQIDKDLFIGNFQNAARLCFLTKKYSSTAHLFGAIDALKQEHKKIHSTHIWYGYEKAILSTRARLGKAIYDTEWEKGNTQTLDETINFILEKCLIQKSSSASNLAQNLLTARERDVLLQLAQGKSNDEIAETLVVVLKTVEKHVSSILKKLGAKNRTEAVSWAVSEGLAEQNKDI
ncbi:MAG: tetratricopeptide repeat protein [Chloroflexi bacterium]|nr:tetratricopeptide repeat protein [Chloroflexota bacterium]